MKDCLHITGGKVYDPVNGIEGQVRDVVAYQGQIVDELPDPSTPDQVQRIDARGCVVTPGGIEVHTHIVNPKLSASLDRSRTETHDPTITRLALSPPEAADAYINLGYTTAIEAAVPPHEVSSIRRAIQEMGNLELGFLLELGNNESIFDRLSQGDFEGAIDLATEQFETSSGFGVKMVNPGNLIHASRTPTHPVDPKCDDELETIDHPIAGTSVTTRKILEWGVELVRRVQISHPLHLHPAKLGVPGNIKHTLRILDALSEHPVHLAHAQFYAYGPPDAPDTPDAPPDTPDTPKYGYTSQAGLLSNYLANHPNVTADVGQIVFGRGLLTTEDRYLEKRLRQIYELQNTTDPLLIDYRADHPVHGVMWAAGLELVLTSQDLWQLSLSVDHPNGGSFTAYPRIIAWLMNKACRDQQLRSVHRRVVQNSRIGGLDRELSLNEIVILTRAAPARALGLTNKGHLGPGADADITIYRDHTSDPQDMFEHPRWVIKAGKIVARDHQIVDRDPSKLLVATR